MLKSILKKTITLILIGGVFTSATACGTTEGVSTGNDVQKSTGDAEKTASADADELTDITLVLDWTPNTNHTGFYVALEEGYYEDAGLNVNIVQPPEDGATMMVASGQAEFGIDFQDCLAPVYTSEDELPITAVAAIIQHNTSAIISLKEDGIESPGDLEGKNYATWELPVEQAMVRNVVESDGGDFSKVNLIPEYIENESAALQTDEVDAVWIYYAWAGIACELAGLDTNVFYFKDITPEFDYYNPVIVTNSNWASENPEIAKAFLEATSRGYEFAIEDPDKAAEILCEQVPELDKELVTESQEWLASQYKAEVDRWGYIDQDRWDSFYKWLFDNELSEEIPAGYGFTNEYLPE